MSTTQQAYVNALTSRYGTTSVTVVLGMVQAQLWPPSTLRVGVVRGPCTSVYQVASRFESSNYDLDRHRDLSIGELIAIYVISLHHCL